MIICVTNQKLCRDDFVHRISQLTKGRPYAVMLREKDLCVDEYERLALIIKKICADHGVSLIINQNITVAKKLNISSIHLSMSDLRSRRHELLEFAHIGASVHSIQEAKEAEILGATYLVAGHVFVTDCKKGVPPRGLLFLKDLCNVVTLPVYGIGGITSAKVDSVLKTGAHGICVMNEAMTCSNPAEFTINFRG